MNSSDRRDRRRQMPALISATGVFAARPGGEFLAGVKIAASAGAAPVRGIPLFRRGNRFSLRSEANGDMGRNHQQQSAALPNAQRPLSLRGGNRSSSPGTDLPRCR
jgi:hypothetical protein